MTTEKVCVSCGETGHTYLECDKVHFPSLVAHLFGVPMLLGGQSKEEMLKNIAEIDAANSPPSPDMV